MSDSSGSTSWTYDLRGRTTKETKVINGTGGGTFVTQWNYDALDRVTWIKYPGGTGGQVGKQVNYTYTGRGPVNSVSGSSVYVSSTNYDAPGRVKLRTLGNGRLTNYVYYPWTTANGLGRVQYIKTGTSSSATSLQYMSYTYDAVGNVLTIKDYKAGGTQTQSFSYDALDRLLTAVASGGSGGTYSQKSYSYNAIGNITNFEGTAYYYQDSAHKHAVTHLGGTSSSYQKYWYDANGNQITRKVGSSTYNLTYDAENCLTGVSGAASATFVYDGDGNRVKATFGSMTTAYVGNHYEREGSTVRKCHYARDIRVATRVDDGSGDVWITKAAKEREIPKRGLSSPTSRSPFSTRPPPPTQPSIQVWSGSSTVYQARQQYKQFT
jgi:YD repeat-containing protein